MSFHFTISFILTFAWLIMKTCNAETWDSLEFQTADILRCKIFGSIEHVMLATSANTIAHISVENGKARLLEETWTEYHRRMPNRNSCRQKGKASLPDAVDRARRDIAGYKNESVFYDVIGCNCEHWVNSWAHGDTYSSQTNDGPSYLECRVGTSSYEHSPVNVLLLNWNSYFYFPKYDTTITVLSDKCFTFTSSSWWKDQITRLYVPVPTNLCVRIWDNFDCQGRSECVGTGLLRLKKIPLHSKRNWQGNVKSMTLCDCNLSSHRGKELFIIH